jgi:hypothetical protein
MGGTCSAVGTERGVYKVLVGKPEERDYWGDPGVDGKIIFGWIFRKWDVGVWTGLGWFRIDRWRALVNAVGNELSGPIKPGELPD